MEGFQVGNKLVAVNPFVLEVQFLGNKTHEHSI